MDENRDEILANFQSITALDVGEAILYLEGADWDLLTAIQRALPQDDSGGPSATAAAPVPLVSPNPEARTFNDLTAASNNNNAEDTSSSAAASSQNRMMSYNIPASNSRGRRGTNHSSSSHSTNNNNNNNNSSNGQSSSGNNNHNHTTTTASGSSSSSSSSSREYTFIVHHNANQHRIKLNGHSTVNDLKERIAAQTGVVACRQGLGGWPSHSKQEAQNGTAPLRSLSLARETDLNLTDLTAEGFMIPAPHELDVVSRLNSTFTLNVLLEPEGRAIPLKMSGVTTYLDVKNSVYAVTNIAARHQAWTGWPCNVTDTTTLAQSGVGLEHNFTVKSSFLSAIVVDDDDAAEEENNDRVEIDDDTEDEDDDDFEMPPTSFGTRSGGRRTGGTRLRNFGRNNLNNNMDVFEVDSSDDEIENASDEYNADDDLLEDISNMHRSTALMTDNVSDELSGSVMFNDNYTQRYGDSHPEFYTGTLADAIAEATQKPARDRKLLALYLHHDRSVLTNVFCSQLLGYETIIEELNSNFVLFGWDLTYEANKNMLLSSVTSSIGTTASMTVREIGIDRLPAMIVVAKLRSNCEVYSVIYGNLGVNDLMVQLLELVERYVEQKAVESRDEQERAEREAMLMEQDMAYNESLAVDRAKAEERQRKEQMADSEKKRLESEKAEAEAKREASRLQAEQTLPVEPSADYAGAMMKIRVRQPNGQSKERRFTAETKLNILLNYVASIGFPKDEYKMFSGWPRKDLTAMDLDSTLQDLRLCAQETIILEER